MNLAWGDQSELDEHRQALARGKYSTVLSYGTDQNLSRDLAHLIGLLPASTARDHLQRKFEGITDLFAGIYEYRAEAEPTFDRLAADRLGELSIDIILDLKMKSLRGEFDALVSSLNPDRPGEAFFQGLVYTHGYFHASEEVTVIGAVAALKSTSGPVVPIETVGPDTLEPGDVYLLDGSRLVFVENFFKAAPVHAGPGGEGTDLVLWMSR